MGIIVASASPEGTNALAFGRKSTITTVLFVFTFTIVAQFCFVAGLSASYEIRPEVWTYKSRYDIGYEVAHATTSNDDNSNIDDRDAREPILLLNGFGVGSFHQHRLIPELLNSVNGDDPNHPQRTVYCMDYLGQGRSWPKDCQDGRGENEKDLQYSADMWCEQIIDFIEAIVLAAPKENGSAASRVHIVGNSVGGHLAAHVAVRRPDLVASLCLLNPTPVWGSKLIGWNGHLPAPVIPKAVGRYLFDRIRDLNTIEQFLDATYSRREAFTDELMHQIRSCTLGNGGHAAFASIMWSPPLVSGEDGIRGDFQDCLKRVPCDVLLVFGKDDPWCKPAFARNMIAALEEREKEHALRSSRSPVHRYIEITNTGHCPNHEAPRAVGHLVNRWVDTLADSSDGDCHREALSLIEPETGLSFSEEWGEMTVQERQKEDIKLGWVDKIMTSVL